MAELIRELMELRSSDSVVKDFGFKFGTDLVTGLKPTDVRYDIMLDMFRSDPVLATATDITVESVTNNGFKFFGENDRTIADATKLFFDDFDFDRVVENILYSLLIYGDAYLEIKREDSPSREYNPNKKITELHPLETSEMFMQHDVHAKMEWFIQKPPGKSSKDDWVYFHPENIVHFRLKWIGTRVYSYNPMEPIGKSYATKVYAYNYLKCIFENMPPKMIHILMGANDDQEKGYRKDLESVKQNPRRDVILRMNNKDENGFELKEFQVKFDNGLAKVMDHLRQEVLMITRVPPIWVGMIDGSNRSTSEALIYPFELRVRKLQQLIASDINKKLLPKLGYNKIKFSFNPVAFSSETSIMEIANVMKGLGLEAEKEGQDHPIVHYLKQKGIQIPNYTKIPGAEEMAERATMVAEQAAALGGQTATGQSEGAPSRARENKANPMKSKLNDKGASAAGKEKLKDSKAKVS